jgi:hypothetical protein
MIEKAIGWFARRRFRKHPLLDQLYPVIEQAPELLEQRDPFIYLYWKEADFEHKRASYLNGLFEVLIKITEDKTNEVQLLEVYRNLIADNLGEFSKYHIFFQDSEDDEFKNRKLRHPCNLGLKKYQEKLVSLYWYEEYRQLGSLDEIIVQIYAWYAEAYFTMLIGGFACKILGDETETWLPHYTEAACGMREFQYRVDLEIDNFETDLGIQSLLEFNEIHTNVCKGYRDPLEGVELLDHTADPKLIPKLS